MSSSRAQYNGTDSPGFLNRVGARIDDLVSVFSPATAIKRRSLRRYYAATSYKGAERGRLRGNWVGTNGSADADTLRDLPVLRERSRDLNRNDAHAAGITDTVTLNTVGSGIRPQSHPDAKALGLTDEQTKEFQRQAERVWRKWCSTADASGRQNFYGLQELAMRQILENGEVFALMPSVPADHRPYHLAIQLIEADRVDTPSGQRSDANIRAGIELGEFGEPQAYYIRKTHPGDIRLSWRDRGSYSPKFTRYPARNELGRLNVIHLYHQLRPGQTRGVPFFAPVMNYFKDMADYLEAELVAARVAACFAAIIEQTNAYDAGIGRADSTNDRGQRLETLEPGMVERLKPGEKITQVNPMRPGVTFDPFVERVLRAISAGLNLPYEVVAKDFSRTNYSSARAAILEARRFFRFWQSKVSEYFCQPIWDMLLEEAYLVGDLPASSFYDNRSDWTRANWISPGWGWVDPTKEVEASRSSIEGNLSTLADEAAVQGKDWEETLEQRAREEKKIKELGLESKPLPGKENTGNQPQEEPAAVPSKRGDPVPAGAFTGEDDL